MTTFQRAVGWRPDAPGRPYEPGHAMLSRLGAASVLSPLGACSLLEFRPERLFQGGVGSCVSVGSKGMFLDYCAANGLPRFEVSERALYWQSRVLEYVGDGTPDDVRERVAAAGDTGAFPWLAFQAWRELGLVPYNACPGSEPWTPEDIRMFVEVQPAPAVFLGEGYERRGLETARVTLTGIERVRQVAALLQNRCPVGFGCQVDLAFLRNAGEVVTTFTPYTSQGGHWMRVVAVLDGAVAKAKPPAAAASDETEIIPWLRSFELRGPEEVTGSSVVVVSNTWRNWGLPNGMGLFGAAFWAQHASDVTAVRWVPTGGSS